MPVPTPCPIAPSAAEHVRLKKMAYGHKTEHRLRVRAQVVLHAPHGRSNTCIARETGLHLDTVRRWRGRFAQASLPGLKDRQRCGPPASFTPLQAADDKAPACRLPAESEVPLSHRSCPELAREAARRGITPFMSASTVRRWLAQDALKPWQHRSGTFITSPGFWLKAAWVLHLYALTRQGEQLGDDEYVISADEKTSIQAWCHCHPSLAPARPGRCASITPTDAAVPWPTSPPTTSTPRRCSATPTPATTRRSPAWAISSRPLQESEPEEPA